MFTESAALRSGDAGCERPPQQQDGNWHTARSGTPLYPIPIVPSPGRYIQLTLGFPRFLGLPTQGCRTPRRVRVGVLAGRCNLLHDKAVEQLRPPRTQLLQPMGDTQLLGRNLRMSTEPAAPSLGDAC